jgi:SPP1 family predicted phage head-tail adaptor
MSYGKMNTLINIVSTTPVKDSEGFATTGDTALATIRAYFEPKNGTEKWQSSAVFAEADALFRFRAIPGLAVTTEMVIALGGQRYNIISVENVRGRNMYLEVLGKAVDASGQS